jgi:hypothetical protein
MDEIEEIPTGDTEQQVVRSAPGDWLMVGLASLVLGGGLLIAAINLLGLSGPDATATASSQAVASNAPLESETAQASIPPRPLHERTVDPDAGGPVWPPGVPEEFTDPVSWLEAVGEVPLYSSPSGAGREVAKLPPGTVLLVQPDTEAEGWWRTVNAVTVGGYIDARSAASRASFNLYAILQEQWSGAIDRVVSTPDRLLAWVQLPSGPGVTGAASGVYSSTDGEHWDLVEDLPPDLTVAEGPSGWIGISSYGWGGQFLWSSDDGSRWDYAGLLNAIGVQPGTLVGSELGYALVNSLSDIRYAPVVWYSPDGLTWQESVDPFGRSEGDGRDALTRLLATDEALIAWTTPGSCPQELWSPGAPCLDPEAPNQPLVAISHDGHQWDRIPMEDPHITGGLQVVAVGDRLIAVATTPGIQSRAWSLDLSADGPLVFARDPQLEAGIADLGSMEIASNGDQIFALGDAAHMDGDSSLRVLVGDGRSWSELAIDDPGQFGPTPRLGAAGPQGLVLIGSRPTTAGDNPILWHLRADGSWVAEPEPIVSLVADPPPEACQEPPTSALQFVLLPPSWGPQCFGDQPITFTAWVGAGSRYCLCAYDDPQVPGTPAWLMAADAPIRLSPAAGGSDYAAGAYYDAPLDWTEESPSEPPPYAEWFGHWVRVTGHFADAASATCTSYAADFTAQGEVSPVDFCRQHFVVTEATVLDDGP